MVVKDPDLSKVTYLSVVPNKSDKVYQDIDSIISIGINSSKGLNFGKKIIYTYVEPTVDPIDFEIKMIDEIPHDKFGDEIFKIYAESFDTEYVINFHCDGFIQNPKAWSNSYLDYDYIGAPIYYGGKIFCGNGGFSLRSKKICQRAYELFIDNKNYLRNHNEDVVISYFLRNQLENEGFRIPSLDVASRFSTEHHSEDRFNFESSFGMHEIEALYNPSLIHHRKKLQFKTRWGLNQ